MKLSRKAAVLAVAVALLATGCSRFAPKAGVGVNVVSVDLAFGIDVEKLLDTPTPTFTPPTLPPVTTPPPPPPPPTIPPPPLPRCLPAQTQSTKDGAAPTTIKNQEFTREGEQLQGSKPREGNYFSWFQFNYTSQEIQEGYSYRTIDELHNIQVGGGFAYDVQQPLFGHAIDITYVVVPEPEEANAGGSSGEVAGIYIQEMKIPFKDREDRKIERRTFQLFEPGTRLVEFPIATGNKSTDQQAVPASADTSNDVPVLGGAANVLSITSTVGARDTVFVCDQIADAWRVDVTLEITGDVDIRMVGNFWIAPQYGGWPIQELFTIDGGTDHVSGNFFSRLARLDPGSVA